MLPAGRPGDDSPRDQLNVCTLVFEDHLDPFSEAHPADENAWHVDYNNSSYEYYYIQRTRLSNRRHTSPEWSKNIISRLQYSPTSAEVVSSNLVNIITCFPFFRSGKRENVSKYKSNHWLANCKSAELAMR